MAQSILQTQRHDSVLSVVVLGQLHLTIEDGNDMLSFEFLRHRISSVTLQAKRIAFSPQEMIILTTVRHVASSTALAESWLMMHGFLGEIGDVTVAGEADVNGIRFGKSRLPTGMGSVAIRAIARGARMLDFGRVDEFSLVVVAGHAKRLDIGLREHNLAVFGGSVANLTLLVSKRRVCEFGHQLGNR